MLAKYTKNESAGKGQSQVLREPLKAAMPPWLLFAMLSGTRRGAILSIFISQY